MSTEEGGAQTQFASKGSQRWMQVAVSRFPDLLLQPLRVALHLGEDDSIDWKSPLQTDGHREYRDAEALRRVGIRELALRPLAEFWPPRGPVWDALGVTKGGEPIFVEAKAHIPEAASNGTAAGEASRQLIEKSLAEARAFYAPRSRADWTGTFYQYANRLAHHYLLRQLNNVPAHLVFLYFLNDEEMGAASESEWRGAIRLLHAALGLPADLTRFGVHDVFIDSKPLQTSAESP